MLAGEKVQRCCRASLHKTHCISMGKPKLPVHCLCLTQVSEVCHTSLLDRRPGGRERWQPRVAHIR